MLTVELAENRRITFARHRRIAGGALLDFDCCRLSRKARINWRQIDRRFEERARSICNDADACAGRAETKTVDVAETKLVKPGRIAAADGRA